MSGRRFGGTGIRRGIRSSRTPAGGSIRALSGFTASDYYRSAQGITAPTGEGTVAVVFYQAGTPTGGIQQLFDHGGTAAGFGATVNAAQFPQIWQRGLTTASPTALAAGGNGTVRCLFFTHENGAGRSTQFDGRPETGNAAFTATADPAGTARLYLGAYNTGTLPLTGYGIVGLVYSSTDMDEAAGDDWWLACCDAREVLTMPGEIHRWDAAGLTPGDSPSTLSDRVGSDDLSLVGSAIDVLDISSAAWSYRLDVPYAAATPVASASGTWTGYPRIMIAGDSITEGADATGGNAWVRKLRDAVEGASLSARWVGQYVEDGVNHEGLSGDDIGELDARIAARITAETPDVLILAIGSNSLPLPLATDHVEAYDALLATVFAADATLTVICALVGTRAGYAAQHHRDAMQQSIRRLVTKYATVDGRDISVVDTSEAYTLAHVVANDGIHPEDSGHAALGTAHFAGLRAVIDGQAFSVPWLPSSITGVFDWWTAADAHDTGTGKCDSLVGRVEGVDLVQATDSLRPDIIARDNAPCLQLSADYLRAALGSTLTQPFTWLAVVEYSSGVYLIGGDNGVNRCQVYVSTTWRAWSGAVLNSTSAPSSQQVIAAVLGTSGKYYVDDLGTPAATGSAGANSVDGLTLGAAFNGSSPMSCYLWDLVLVDGEISTGDLASFAAYAEDRYSWTETP